MAKKVIFVASSDWHLNKWPAFNENNRRMFYSLDQFRLISKVCRKYEVPHLFCADLIHKPKDIDNELNGLVGPFYQKYFEEYHIPFIGIDGNHDMSHKNFVDKRSPTHLDRFKLFKTFHNISFNSFEHEGTVIWGIPYLNNNIGFEDTVKKYRKQLDPNKRNILLIHTDLPGALDTNGREVNTADNISPRLNRLFKGFDLVLSGHIHKPQQISNRVWMLGALQQQSRKDAGCEMGYWLIYDDNTVEFKPVKTYPQFKEYFKGEEKPDDFHYYDEVIPPTKDVEEEGNFSTKNSKASLVKKYMKISGIKSRSKKELLLNLLTE